VKWSHLSLQAVFAYSCFMSEPASESSTETYLTPELNYLATCLALMTSPLFDADGLDCWMNKPLVAAVA